MNTMTKAKAQNKSEIITLRVSPEIKKDLEYIADFSNRSRSFVAEEGLSQYVQYKAWETREIDKALKEAEEGVFTSHDKVMKWMKQIAKTGKKVKIPKPDTFLKKK